MQDLMLYIRLLLAMLFLTTAIPKWKEFEVHVAIVADYKMIPEKLTRLFAWLELIGELLSALLLLFGVFQPIVTALVLLLLFVFTIAILTNLLRGRTEVSCGCGGAAGNHQLSWWLILRNIVLLLGAFLLLLHPATVGSLQSLFQGSSFHADFPIDVVTILFVAGLTLLVASIANELQQIRHWFQTNHQQS